MVTALAVIEPHQFADAIARLDDEQIVTLVASASGSGAITKYARRAARDLLRTHASHNLAFEMNSFSRGQFASEVHRASAIVDTLAAVEELTALRRFAVAAAHVSAAREGVAAIVMHLVKVLPAGSGGGSPERISAIIDTLVDYEDEHLTYGVVQHGFSIPVVQLAARAVLERSRWMPTPAEFLEECRIARRFFLDTAHAAKVQRDLVRAAGLTLISNISASADDEIDF